MFAKLDSVVARYENLNAQLANPDITHTQIQELSKERSKMTHLVEKYQEYLKVKEERAASDELLNDEDEQIRLMGKEEITRLDLQIEEMEREITILLLPKDPNDEKNIILELRAGTGGDEASLFAADLFGMYSYFAKLKGFKVDMISASGGNKEGYKELIANISGDQVYSWFKYEAGVHRVQRVPKTETQGRIHTSACTVAILPEAEEVDIQIAEKDLRIDVFRSGGPGGQSVNTTDSAVRITHIPTGVVVQCQDEKSQWKNKAKAMTVLRARLYEAEQARVDDERSQERKLMVKSGDRSDKIRTYNFPQDRCTDHRIGLTVHGLERMLHGEIEDFITQIRTHYQTLALKSDS